MTLTEIANLLQAYADQLGNTAAVVTLLNTPSVQRTNTSRQIFGDVKGKLGIDLFRKLLAAMNTAGTLDPVIDGASTQFKAVGLNFADPDVRESVDAMKLAGLLTQAEADAVKALGIWYETPFVAAGGTGTITAAEVQAGTAVLSMREWFEGQAQTVRAGIESGALTTVAEILAAMS